MPLVLLISIYKLFTFDAEALHSIINESPGQGVRSDTSKAVISTGQSSSAGIVSLLS